MSLVSFQGYSTLMSTCFRYAKQLAFQSSNFTFYKFLCKVRGRRDFSAVSAESSLDGVRVIDLTRIVAGPFCTMALGDLGAEVVKIERPGAGDEARKWGPPFVRGSGSGQTCYFVALNRNKKSVCIDLKSAAGVAIVRELARCSDVLIENYVPGKLDGLGLGYDQLKAEAPGLIYLSLTGYGPEGPYRERPGYDVIAASIGGLLGITGPAGGEPCKAGVAMTDLATGLFAHGAILAALLQRQKTGLGQKIDCDLLSTQVACLINAGSAFLNGSCESTRRGTAHESIVPYETFATADGHLTVGAGSDRQFTDMCERIGLPSLARDGRFASNQKRVKHRVELIAELRKRFAASTTEEWIQRLEGAKFPYGRVNTIPEVFNDPHICARGLVQEVTLHDGARVRIVGPPVKYSESLNAIRGPPPALGQHTDEVLSSVLGYSSEKIESLRRSGVIE